MSASSILTEEYIEMDESQTMPDDEKRHRHTPSCDLNDSECPLRGRPFDPDDTLPSRYSRRSGDEGFVSTARAVDSGLQISRRFVEIVIILVGFGATLGMNWQKFSALTDKVDSINTRLDVTDKRATQASVDAGVALQLQKEEKERRDVDRIEMDQWRATFKAIAMIQAQGGGRVTIQIPERPRDAADRRP